MATNAKQKKRNGKVPLYKATAAEIIAGLGITATDMRYARAAIAAARKQKQRRSKSSGR